MFPGSNILADALSIIDPTVVSYYKASGRTPNALYQDITTYDTAISLSGSFQPVDRNMYETLGLDLQKSYWVFYASQEIIDVQRDRSNDKIIFSGSTYQCISGKGNWFKIDGWVGMLCVLSEGRAA